MNAHNSMGQQAFDSKPVEDGLLRLLLDYAGFYEALRKRATGRGTVGSFRMTPRTTHEQSWQSLLLD